MRWSRVLPVLAVVVVALSGCGKNDVPSSSPYSPSTPAEGGDLRQLGEPIDVGGLRVRVTVDEVGGDKDGPWVTTTMRVKNVGTRSVALPDLRLVCSGSTTFGYSANSLSSLRPGRSTTIEVPLLISNTADEDDYYEPIARCEGTASISVWVTSGSPDFTESTSDGWQVDATTHDEINARLPFTRPGGEPKDPDRPYAWVEGEYAPEAYQVVSVPGMTFEQAIRILDPVRGSATWEDYERVMVAEHDRGVVLFTYDYIPDKYVRALSRRGVAASFASSINADTHILVARKGRVVRSFEPMLGQDFKKTKPLPEEQGLDLEYDTWPASWTLLERITGIHITEGWLLDDSHPGFRLRD